MPHLTLSIAPGGPQVDILIGASQAQTDALVAAGQSSPGPVILHGLIDTGASCTCVDPAVLQQLGLKPTGMVSMLTASTGHQTHDTYEYDVSLTLLHPDRSLRFETVPVVETQLSNQGFDALIGRDILEHCLLVYDGRAGTFALAY